jgi:sugar lactone lactonase YvrE
MITLTATEELVETDEALAQPTGHDDAETDRSACSGSLFGFQGGHIGGLVVAGDGTLLVSETSSAMIWRLGADVSPMPIVGPGAGGSDQPIRLLTPGGLAIGPDGTLFVADTTHHRICAISPEGSVRVVAGRANGYRDGPADEAMFRFPADVAVASDGTCYVADTVNDRIRAVTPDGEVSTLAGSIYDYGDGHGAAARFRRPAAVDIDDNGILYIADAGNNAIRAVAPDGVVTTVAGSPPGGDDDGLGAEVGLRWPTGIAVDADGSLWVADHGNGVVRHVDTAGRSRTELRLSGLRPTVLARGQHGHVIMAAEAWAPRQAPRACVMTVGDGQ